MQQRKRYGSYLKSCPKIARLKMHSIIVYILEKIQRGISRAEFVAIYRGVLKL
jgi:hypothetical protein